MPYSNSENAPKLSELFSLNNKTALIIGGAGLLGGEMAYALAELGARVIVASRDKAKCDAFVSTLNAHYSRAHIALSLDITQKLSLEICFQAVREIVPEGLDILINSGWSGRKNTFESITDENWNDDIEVCLNGVFRSIKTFVPLLILRKGNIVNIASMYGHVAPDYRLYDSEQFSNPPSYGAAKAGIIQLTKYLASFLSVHPIRVNCVSPGPFPYESTQKENPAFIRRLSEKNPLNRIGKPYELKGVVALLCSEAGAYITGQNICVDGGWGIW